MRIDFLSLRSFALSGLMSLFALGMLGCAQTDQRWTTPQTQIEKLPVLQVTPVVIARVNPSLDSTPAVSSEPIAATPTQEVLYDVAFDYHGQNFVSRLPFDPGAWVWVASGIAPFVPGANTAPEQNTVASKPEALTPPPTISVPSITNLQTANGPVFGAAPETALQAPLYVLPPNTQLTAYPLVYSSLFMATPAFFYGGGYYPYHYRSHFGGEGRGGHRGGRGGHGRR
jgi:hypothetical protein